MLLLFFGPGFLRACVDVPRLDVPRLVGLFEVDPCPEATFEADLRLLVLEPVPEERPVGLATIPEVRPVDLDPDVLPRDVPVVPALEFLEPDLDLEREFFDLDRELFFDPDREFPLLEFPDLDRLVLL